MEIKGLSKTYATRIEAKKPYATEKPYMKAIKYHIEPLTNVLRARFATGKNLELHFIRDFSFSMWDLSKPNF